MGDGHPGLRNLFPHRLLLGTTYAMSGDIPLVTWAGALVGIGGLAAIILVVAGWTWFWVGFAEKHVGQWAAVVGLCAPLYAALLFLIAMLGTQILAQP